MASPRPNRLIRESRLLVSRPEVVYVELEKYGQLVRDDRLGQGDDDLEQNLLARQDRLIDLGLAQHCHNKDVWTALYHKSQSTSTGLEERYLKGLRQACLSNENARGAFSKFPHIEPQELAKFLRDGDGDDLHTLLTNPAINERILVQLLKGEESFTQVDEDHRRKMVYSVAENPRLVDDTSDEHGPDLFYNDIRDAIFEMLAKVPVTWPWLTALHHLHFRLMSGKNESAKVPVTQVIKRWAVLPPTDDKDEREGYYSELTLKQEFIVIVSAMYGVHFYKEGEQYKSDIVGAIDSPELAQRCAFYANGKLTGSDMQQAHDRDGDAYVLAALCNESLYLDRELRRVLEDQIDFRQRWLYIGRCEAIAKSRSYFNPKPLDQEMFQDDDETPPAPSNEMVGIKTLQQKVAAMETRIAASRSLLISGFVIIGLLIWIR